MTRVVVAGSDNSVSFVVIDLTNPIHPIVTRVNPNLGGNCRVVLDGVGRCFVGNGLGGQVREVDVSNPTNPLQRGMIQTVLAGIGALAVQGDLVAVGEWVNAFNARVALLDFSNADAPVQIGIAPTPLTSTPSPDPNAPNPPAVTSIGFTGPRQVIAVGSSDPEIVKVDFSSPRNPVVTTFLSGFTSVTMDSDATRIVAGDQTGPQVKLFSANTNTVIAGPIGTMLNGVTSLALAFPFALAGSINDSPAARVTFSGAGGSSTLFVPLPGGGFTTAIDGREGACGEINGSRVALIDLAPATPVVLGTVDSGLGSIGTLSIRTLPSDFSPQITGVSTTTVRPGSEILVSGSGFDPARQYLIAFQQNGQQTIIKHAAVVPPTGTFTVSVTIPVPPIAQPGVAFIVACITSPRAVPKPCTQQQITLEL